jgi:hypothetical protein
VGVSETNDQPEVKRLQRKERVIRAVHTLTGFLLIAKGLHKLSDGEPAPVLVTLTLVGGALALAAAVFHHRFHDSRYPVGALISLIESAACLLVAVSYVEDGASYIQYAYFFASITALAAAAMQLWRQGAARATH